MNIHLEPFTDVDMPLFITWLNSDHVKPWYSPIESWIDEISNRSNEFNWIRHYIIYDENLPIGFCQYYPYWRGGEEWNGSIPVEGSYSIDYLIGNTGYLRKGCASAAIKLLNSMINNYQDAKRIIVQPEEDNLASRNTLLSAGYSYDRENMLYIHEL